MENIKPWQAVLMVLAVVVLGMTIWNQLSKPRVDLPGTVLVVDVETGDLYRMKLGKRNGAYFPERNPETDRHTLMPVEQDDSGEWRIVGHAMAALADVEGELKVVNASSGVVTIESEDILDTLKAGG